jgi:hypothetical protein
MTGLGVVLLALGLGDLVAGGLSGQPVPGRRCVFATLIAFAIALTGAFLFQYGRLNGGLLVLVATVGTSPWYFSRAMNARPSWALLWLAVAIAPGFVLSGSWAAPQSVWLEQWLRGLPFGWLTELTQGELVLGLGVLAVLASTANGVVRSVLRLASPDLEVSEQRLKGGRIIGVVERVLIFGLAVSGEPTAAGLVISAKSILRFPEISRSVGEGEKSGGSVDLVTEYFLLGSLVSWATALFPVVLFLR